MNGKYNAAKLALKFVKDEIVLGIGSGTTVEIFLNLLGEEIKKNELTVYGVPSSYQSQILAVKNGIKIVDLLEYPELDLCVDGADQVDSQLNCIKGGGGAMTREKIVACASNKVVIIVDESKLSENLNAKVPVEVIPFAYGFVKREISKFAKKQELRWANKKLGPIITDNGNFILDCEFGVIKEPERLEQEINNIPGVVENGIFPSKIIDLVIVGTNNGAWSKSK